MQASPDISFVLPVYNKADILPAVLRALAAQTIDAQAEFIFVDDASTDGSLPLLQDRTAGLPRARVVANSQNAGPSIRLNQGAALAAGRYLCLLDADELVAPNAIATMLHLLRDHAAPMVHGKVAITDQPGESFIPPALPSSPPFALLSPVLPALLGNRGFVRMCWLVETGLFRSAGGCDPRLFIQDEALPLRLALSAARMIDLQAPATYAPPARKRLSADKGQQHHDRFFAHYLLFRDHPELPPVLQRQLTRKCMSTAWKAVRSDNSGSHRLAVFFRYAASRLGLLSVPEKWLAESVAYFAARPGIRRTPEFSEKGLARV